MGRKLETLKVGVHHVKKAAGVLGTGDAPEREIVTGREKKTHTHPRTDKMLECEVKKHPFITARTLKDIHAGVMGEASV